MGIAVQILGLGPLPPMQSALLATGYFFAPAAAFLCPCGCHKNLFNKENFF